jgi:hypothetical protein
MVLLAGASYLAAPLPSARADLEITIYDGNSIIGSGTITSAALIGDPNDGGYQVTGKDKNFKKVTVDITSNLPGFANQGTLINTTTSVTPTSGGSGGTITVIVSVNGYTIPGAGGAILSSSATAGSTGTQSATTPVTFQSYVDTSNSLVSTTSALSGATTGGQQSATVPKALTNSLALSTVPDTSFTNTSSYALDSVITIAVPSANENDNRGVSVQGYTAVTGVATPLPGNVVMAASALPMLLAGWYLRRRKHLQLA